MPVCLPYDDPDALYSYCPSFGAAVLFAVLFSITTSTHIYQAIKHKKRFCWVISVAVSWETIGYILRSVSVQHQSSFGIYLAHFLFILLAPIWINAFVYMVMGRMILYFVPEQMVFGIKARRLTLIFVLLDIFSFLVQAFGGSLLAGNGSSSSITTGLDIYRAGVGFQEAFILIFFVLAIRFHRHMNSIENIRQTDWRRLLYAEYAVLVLISIRIIYRLSEYANGFDAYAPNHEWLFYVFDAVPMLTASVLLNVFHPGKYLVGPESEFPKLTRAQKKERKTQEKEEKAVKKAAKEEEKLAKKEGRLFDSSTTSPNDPNAGTVELQERNKVPRSLEPGYV